jgi:hypothetical protein
MMGMLLDKHGNDEAEQQWEFVREFIAYQSQSYGFVLQ